MSRWLILYTSYVHASHTDCCIYRLASIPTNKICNTQQVFPDDPCSTVINTYPIDIVLYFIDKYVITKGNKISRITK